MYLDYIPYESLRLHQDKMLEAVYDAVRKGENSILMVDAPTGTGKTCCISAALAAAPGKVIVAVRTVSQIGIYTDEISKIWSKTRHRPEVSYMVGKQKVCPIGCEFKGESVYAGCSRLREWTKSYVESRLRLIKGRGDVYDPSQDTIPEEEPGYRTFCPYYLRSREAFALNGKVYFRRSNAALQVVEGLKKEVTPPDKLSDACEGLCPYEIMSLYAKSSDIVVVNYSHLFSPDFQGIIFQWLELEPENLTLIVDEAHNLGDAVRSMNSRLLTVRNVELAEKEIDKFEGTLGQARLDESRDGSSWRREGIKVIRTLLPRLEKFILSRQSRMQEGEAILDSDIFRTFLYEGIDNIDDALSYFSDVAVTVAELNLAEGETENLQGDLEPSLAQVLLFLRDVEQAQGDDSYLEKITVTGSADRKWASLEVNKIDPAPVIRKITDNINATVMLSGTFSPLDAYELYFLGEEGRAVKISLPNPFPKENRLLIVSNKATTQLGSRDDSDNRQEISGYIKSLIEGVPGNVAAFFTSYSMMNSYIELCNSSAEGVGKMLFIEPRNSDEVPDLLGKFFAQGARGGGVLLGVCGGKLAEGIDYKGEALHGVAVVGLPLGVYDDIQKEIIAYFTRKYGREKGNLIAYILPAINRGLQAAGRVIRAESERGVLIFCDRRFGQGGLGSVREYLPEWVREELSIADPAQCKGMVLAKEGEWNRGNVSANSFPPYNDHVSARSLSKAKKVGSMSQPRTRRELSRELTSGLEGKKAFQLIETFKDRDRSQRKKAAEGIVGLGKTAVDPLIVALGDKASYVRAMAAYALGNIGDKRAVDPLKRALKDRDSSVRKEAEEALAKLD